MMGKKLKEEEKEGGEGENGEGGEEEKGEGENGGEQEVEILHAED
jgi:hypothetical protein